VGLTVQSRAPQRFLHPETSSSALMESLSWMTLTLRCTWFVFVRDEPVSSVVVVCLVCTHV